MSIIPERTSPLGKGRVQSILGPGGLPTYVVSDGELAHGSSLGNSSCWMSTKSTGAIEAVFSLDVGENVFESCLLRYCGAGFQIVGSGNGSIATAGEPLESGQTFVELSPSSPGRFEIHPVFQRHLFSLPGDIDVEETVFLPTVGIESAAPTACIGIRLRNNSNEIRSLRIYAFAEIFGLQGADLVAEYDHDLKALKITSPSRPDWVRLMAFDRAPSAFESTRDRSLVYEPYEKRPLGNQTAEGGNIMAALQADVELPPRSSDSLACLLSFSHRGEARARESLIHVRDWEKALHRTVSWCAKALSISRVMVPEKVISEGVLWAKANMLRVMGRYPTGAGFTNDPGRSSNVVVRDLAWFVYGCDYLMPRYSAELLRNAARFQLDNGKLVEYWDARTGQTQDYGLNINDDTPLFILAAGHHFMVTRDKDFLHEIYPAVKKAADYLLSQRDHRGLVFCTSSGVEQCGICGWRNVIPGYRLSGAVTEVNAECYAALEVAAEMAKALGANSDVGYLLDQAEGLRRAVNTHLLNRDNGQYYLNIDLDGNPVADVTSDQLFPVMFGISPPEVAFLIISRLTKPDFWTPAGLRTASRNSPEYTPDRDWGLRGGIWPGLSFWYAFAAARYHPESMQRALASFRHYNEDPLRYNTVPGQFSEWFDGESLANRGMRLSPWEPPRLLWAAVEGMLGVVHSLDGYVMQPLMPPRWKWLAVRRLPNGEHHETLFLVRQEGRLHLYGRVNKLRAAFPIDSYDRDVSEGVRCLHPDAHVVALARNDEVMICVGSSADGSITVLLELQELVAGDRWYYMETYDSELQDWIRGAMRRGSELQKVAAVLEEKGFSLLRLMPVRI